MFPVAKIKWIKWLNHEQHVSSCLSKNIQKNGPWHPVSQRKRLKGAFEVVQKVRSLAKKARIRGNPGGKSMKIPYVIMLI